MVNNEDFPDTSDGRRLTFNEFQRKLQQSEIDARTAYFLTLLYEQLSDAMKCIDEMTMIIAKYGEALETFVQMSKQDQDILRSLYKRVTGNGVSVASVANDPFDKS